MSFVFFCTFGGENAFIFASFSATGVSTKQEIRRVVVVVYFFSLYCPSGRSSPMLCSKRRELIQKQKKVRSVFLFLLFLPRNARKPLMRENRSAEKCAIFSTDLGFWCFEWKHIRADR